MKDGPTRLSLSLVKSTHGRLPAVCLSSALHIQYVASQHDAVEDDGCATALDAVRAVPDLGCVVLYVFI